VICCKSCQLRSFPRAKVRLKLQAHRLISAAEMEVLAATEPVAALRSLSGNGKLVAALT
jgi:hypothetical protein